MKDICIERSLNKLRIAIRDNNVLEECFIEEKSEEPVAGEIYKGKIKNIIQGINSVFVDIGLAKEGYMYYSEELKSKGIKKGDEILVEVVKEPIGDKGAKLSNKVSILGRYVVFQIGDGDIKFSKRITDEVKKKLILAEVKPIEDVTITIRTEGEHISIETLKEEIEKLQSVYDMLIKKLNFSSKCGKIYGDEALLTKVIVDNIDKENIRIFLNSEKDYEFVKNFSNNRAEIIKYDGVRSLFDYLEIEKEILKLRHNKVMLKCGGHIIIDKTEAMYVIDVNTGKNIKGRSLDKTILQTNIEAAKEIAKQIRLRNLSGIIVIDFIDLRDKKDRNVVMKALKDAMKSDGGNSKIFPFTELDLVQIARKRRGKSIYDSIEEVCNKCQGAGSILKLSYVESLIKNEILKSLSENTISSFYIELDIHYKERVNGDIISFLKNIDGLDKEIYLNYVENVGAYKVEPIIFKNQKENLKDYKIKSFEKYN